MSDGALRAALAGLDPQPLPDRYALLGYPPGSALPRPPAGEAFALRLDDPFETTVVVREQLVDALPPPASATRGLAAVLLPGELDPQLTGFMAALAAALAARGVPLVPVSAATRDHLLVPGARLDDALAALVDLRASAREGVAAASASPGRAPRPA